MPTPAVVFLWMRVTARGSRTSFAASWGARYRLLPYVYAQVRLCSEGPPDARALFFEYPEDPVNCTVEDE
jgi:alpha-glucosidase (family GH31 glycosyl hydrolase)